MEEKKKKFADGGFVYPLALGSAKGEAWGHGITRRNQLIDNLVANMVAVILNDVDAEKDSPMDVEDAINAAIKKACEYADLTIQASKRGS